MSGTSGGTDRGFLPEMVNSQPSFPPQPIMWSAYAAEEQRHLLEGLEVWVGWLVNRYSLDGRYVPECWAKHWELIEELGALHLAWEGAYATTSHSDAPLAWHERFGATRARLAEWVARTGCRTTEHRPR